MSYTRCDVASLGGLEVRAATGTPLIPNADYVRVEVCPNGLVCITYDWGENAYLLVSVSGGAEYTQHNLGKREAPNSHCPRWVASQNRCLVFKIYPEAGEYEGTYWAVDVNGALHHIGAWDATGTGSMGIRDVSDQGVPQLLALTRVWPLSFLLPAGLQLLNWRERGDYVIGVMSHTYLGVTVIVKSTQRFYRAYAGNVDLLPGIDDMGTVAASGADPGGYVAMSDWLTREYNPFPIDPPDPEPEHPRMISYNDPVEGFKPGELVKHPDGGAYYGIRRPSGKVVACTPDGKLEDRDAMGAWERFRIAKNGASLIAEREGGKVYILPLVE